MSKNLSTYTDNELVGLIQSGSDQSEQAFTLLYDRYSSKIHAYCFRILNNAELAEDIFQETFIKFFNKINDTFQATNVQGYLITIARNLCLNSKRDKMVTVPIDNLEFMFHNSQNYESKELLNLITTSLELLDFDYREAFILREYDGLSYKDIANICGTTVNNAKSRVFRAKQKIKKILNPYLKDLCK
jgi:RNA polymerase sigma factor (sigma-70 family)